MRKLIQEPASNTELTGKEDEINYNTWVVLSQTHDVLARVREKDLQSIGLSWIQAKVLYILKHLDEPIIPARIARWLFREPHTVHSLLTRMQKKGLITLSKGYGKKNIVKVELTAKGEEAFCQSHQLKSIDRIMGQLSSEEKLLFTRYLKGLRDSGIKELNIRYAPYQVFPYP